MSATAQSSTGQRRQAWYRLVLTLLLAAIVIALAQLLASLLSLGSAARADSAGVLVAQATATALANTPPVPGGDAVVPRAKRVPPLPAQQFSTNTPRPPAATATPEPAPATPRPLPTLFVYDGPASGAAPATAIPTAVTAVDRHGMDLLNIVLLGNDNEITGEAVARTDTIIILSINRTTGTVALLNLPRDLYVYIPGWTMQRINLAYPHGEAIGWTDGGFGLLRQTIFYNFGINVHYYAMVNLSGFAALVDAVGGVDLAVDCAIQDLPLIGAEVPAGALPATEEGEFVLPVGMHHMDGAEALWYARSRNSSTDFDRGARQQQVLRAIWRAAREQGLLSRVSALYAEAAPLVQTNLAFEDILSLVPIAANLDPSRIEQFNVLRLYHTTPWQTPDGDYVQLPVYDTLRPMLEDFYTPPTENQLTAAAARIAIFNASGHPRWDEVAAARLTQEGFAALPMGEAAEPVAQTRLVDYTGRTKGSSIEQIARALNLTPQQLALEPSATRDYDYVVTLGADYDSCTRPGVMDVNVAEAAPGG
jgi:LCP family protein required for cell wall assembly